MDVGNELLRTLDTYLGSEYAFEKIMQTMH